MTCAELEELAAELALGSVSGSERAVAIDHLARCAACRELVDELSRVADTMLLLAPGREPPPGFESKVLSRMGVAPARPPRPVYRRRGVLVGAAAVALVAALAVAGHGWRAGAPAAPVAAPAAVPGVRTALLADEAGRWTCRVLAYGERPTWLVVSLDRSDGLNASFTVEAVDATSENPVPVGSFTLQDGHGSLATAIELPVDGLRSVRVVDRGGRVRYEVPFPSS